MTNPAPDAASVTDILAEAANAQFRAADFMGEGVLRGIAPAKVNLFLGVGPVRADGRHEVENVMHALALHDVLHVNACPLDEAFAHEAQDAIAAGSDALAFSGAEGQLLVSVDVVDKTTKLGEAQASPLDVPAAENLAFKAAAALAEAAGRKTPEHVRIRIEKQVPAQAGLGGGSSDAACVLSCGAWMQPSPRRWPPRWARTCRSFWKGVVPAISGPANPSRAPFNLRALPWCW